MNKYIVEECFDGERLDLFLQTKDGENTRSHIKKQIEDGKVSVNGKVVTKAGYKLSTGDEVTCEITAPEQLKATAEDIDIEIVYQDDDIAVINKPQGMVVHPSIGNHTGTLVNALLFKMDNLSGINGVIRPGIVHRLDKDTSGLLVIAKNDKAHVNLSKQIADKTCKREYVALLDGILKQQSGMVENYLGRDPKNRLRKAVVSPDKGKYAKTLFFVEKYYEGYTLVRFELYTGRTHQIRVHAKELRHPVVGDPLYNGNKCKFNLKGQLLHARKLTLTHPTTGKVMTFEAPLPDYFQRVLNSLKEIK